MEYKQVHGDCNVPHAYKANPLVLLGPINQTLFLVACCFTVRYRTGTAYILGSVKGDAAKEVTPNKNPASNSFIMEELKDYQKNSSLT